MAPKLRTFFIRFVWITGIFYFLYVVYISNLYVPLPGPTPRNRTLGNKLHSSSTLRPKRKEEIRVHLYTVIDSVSNRNDNSNRSFSASENLRNKTEGISENYTKINPIPVSRVVHRSPPKGGRFTVYNIAQGIPTRKLYDSGFKVANAELCPDSGNRLKIVILITSAPGNWEERKAIRQTWGHFRLRNDVAIAFLLGRSSAIHENRINNEYTLYGDIILANFYDSYTNLTLKTTSLLEWVDSYCNQTAFVLKTDDDMFINVPKLLTFISKHSNEKRKIFGRLAQMWKPIRRKLSKYYVSKKQFKPPVFPDFTTGPAYLMTSDIIHDLYTTALDMVYLTLEDVFTTGIVAERRNVERVNVDEFLNYHLNILAFNVSKTITIHSIKPFEQYVLWRLLDERTSD